MLLGARQFFERRGAPTPPLPYDAEVQYLESTGTQWIDTGISWDVYRDIGFRVKLNPLVSANIDPVVGSFCGYSNWGSRWFGVNYTSLSSRGIQVGLGKSGAYYSGDMLLRDYDVEVSSVRGVWIDGTQIEFSYGSDVSRSGTSFYLFATCARDGSGVNHISPRRCRIYSLTMYDGADVLEDLIPVRFTNELGQSEGAMYDRVSRQLFRNQGTGNFIVGRDTNPISARSYVNDGLVAMWDGIENAGWGVHDPNATEWKDLTGNGYDLPLSAATLEVLSNGVRRKSTGTHSTASKVGWINTPSRTLEMCVTAPSSISNGSQVLLATTSVETVTFVPCLIKKGVGYFEWSQQWNSSKTIFKSNITLTLSSSYNYDNAAKGYVNGEVQAANNTDTWGFTADTISVLGDPRGMNFAPFGYCAHNVRIYSRALTASEIAANYAIDKARFNLP